MVWASERTMSLTCGFLACPGWGCSCPSNTRGSLLHPQGGHRDSQPSLVWQELPPGSRLCRWSHGEMIVLQLSGEGAAAEVVLWGHTARQGSRRQMGEKCVPHTPRCPDHHEGAGISAWGWGGKKWPGGECALGCVCGGGLFFGGGTKPCAETLHSCWLASCSDAFLPRVTEETAAWNSAPHSPNSG